MFQPHPLNLRPQTSMSALESIKAQIKAKRYAEAAEAAFAAANEGRADNKVLALGGAAAYQAGIDGLALELFSRLDARTRLDATDLSMMGHAAERMGHFALAISAYGRALDLKDDDAIVHFNLGSVYLRRHRWSDAISHLQKARDLAPDMVAIYGNLGRALLGTENYDACVDYYRDCMARFPDEIDFQAGLAETLMRKGDRSAAETEFRALVKRDKRDAGIWTGLIAAVIQDERYDEAQRMIAEARADGAASPDLDELEASLKQETGDLSDAIALYDQALAAAPNHRRARVNLIEALLRAGKADRALEFCDQRLAEIPGDVEMLAYKGLVLIDLGRVEDSATLLPPNLIMGYRPICPAGFASMADFNRAMVDHILNHPSLEPSPPNHATVSGRHTGSLVCEPWGPMRHFTEMIAAGARSYRKRNDPSNHPFFARWSEEYSLTVWAVEMNAGGHQMPHIHPSGFLSGVYYPQLPDQVQDTASVDGFIEFFRAPDQFDLRHDEPVELFPPQEGVMYLFPSAYFHRTIPFTGDGTRLSVAFDLVPF